MPPVSLRTNSAAHRVVEVSAALTNERAMVSAPFASGNSCATVASTRSVRDTRLRARGHAREVR